MAWERSSDEASAFVDVGRRSVMFGATSADHDRLDPAEALLREVGAQLRQVRLDRGEDLDEVARHLRIKSAYLFGIEQGDLSALPGRTYALGFLRTYADYLGFDGADLVARIKSSVGELTDRTRLRIRAPMPENRLPRTPMVVISLGARRRDLSRLVVPQSQQPGGHGYRRGSTGWSARSGRRGRAAGRAGARGAGDAGRGARVGGRGRRCAHRRRAPAASPPAGAQASSAVESSPDRALPAPRWPRARAGRRWCATDAPPDDCAAGR